MPELKYLNLGNLDITTDAIRILGKTRMMSLIDVYDQGKFQTHVWIKQLYTIIRRDFSEEKSRKRPLFNPIIHTDFFYFNHWMKIELNKFLQF